ncbi:MAG: hypothetical protein ACP5FZ_12095 [Fidelibacterota bacterium]
MNSKYFFQQFAILSILIIFALKINAQEKGKFGITIKSQLVPQIGISYGFSDKIQTRVSTFLEFDDGDLFYSNISSLSVLIGAASDKSIYKYIGPDVTFNGYQEVFYLGLILGVQYRLHPKFGVFAEFGPSFKVINGIDSFSFLNTGIGIKYHFK